MMGNLDLANHDLKSAEDIETTSRLPFQITIYVIWDIVKIGW